MTPERRSLAIKIGIAAVVAAVAIILPQNSEPTAVKEYVQVMYFAIAALGLALLTGFSGQISIGHGAFMGMGAYTTAILVADHGWPWFGATAAAVLVSFAAGALVGLPALRIRGTALALATLGLAVLFPQIIKRFDDITGGSQGKRVPADFDAPEWAADLGIADDQWLYYVVLAFTVVSFLLVRNLVKSRVGRGLISIRDNEVAAEVSGVNVAVYKVTAFGLSAALAGLGGSLLVYRTGFVDPGGFDIQLSIRLLVMAVVGGVATIGGPLIGSGLVFYVNETIKSSTEELAPVLFGAALIGLMLVMPDGIVGGGRRLWRRVMRSRRPAGPPADPAGPDNPDVVETSQTSRQ
jgi:branched-chain amino acid transport system permease protein